MTAHILSDFNWLLTAFKKKVTSLAVGNTYTVEWQKGPRLAAIGFSIGPGSRGRGTHRAPIGGICKCSKCRLKPPNLHLGDSPDAGESSVEKQSPQIMPLKK